MKRKSYTCDFCNMTSTRWWNIRRHIERRHATMMANLNSQTRNEISNVSENFQMNPTNFQLPNYYTDNMDNNFSNYDGMRTNSNFPHNKRNSLLQDLMPKIEQLDNFGLFKIRMFILDVQARRTNSGYGNNNMIF